MHAELQQRQRTSQNMRSEHFSARILDARGRLSPARAQRAREICQQLGAVHITRTGLSSTDQLLPLMESLGFGTAEQFSIGGRTSQQVQKKWVVPGLRRMDHYPPALYLLPNNEVQYQRCGPQRVLFFCLTPPTDGGRTFLHAAQAVEDHIRRAGPVGVRFLERLERHGLMIETGFLDQRHPLKPHNYFQSWQERFRTPDPDEAIARARSKTDEYDRCWWKDEGDGLRTLMTRITLSAFKTDPHRGTRYLRFPRLALGAPETRNGYRRYPLGDGTPFSDAERALLLDAYLHTREGIPWALGDIILFDNVRYGHSRESFSGPRAVYVGMAGEVWDDATETARNTTAPIFQPSPPQRAHRSPQAAEHYTLPPAESLWRDVHSARIFDAGGLLSAAVAQRVRQELDTHGAVHVRNTGLRCTNTAGLPEDVLRWLGFGQEERFAWGGFSSGRTERRALGRTLRATDDYPADRWLLPHNEILYQRSMPTRLLFFSAHDLDPHHGGRTLVHSARALEDYLHRVVGGPALLQRLEAHGFLIEMGFLDERHPRKAENYFRSWQDRFDTAHRDEAEARCRAATEQFDHCWWRPEDVRAADGSALYTLMTRIQVPAFQRHPETGERYLFFPRIALDAPALHNGHRRFPLGDGHPLTTEEVDLLLEAYLRTREGIHWAAGDILLVDNIRYGHSREPYAGPRELGVAMAGRFQAEQP